MKVFFFGIYELGTISLGRLIEAGVRIAGVATKRQEGSHLEKFVDLARRHRIPLFPLDPGEERQLVPVIKSSKPDIILVSGYHRLLPASILGLAPRGGVNLHPSLLPKYRGPCPWKWVIVRGERWTGVTVHEMDASFDTGRILSQEPVKIRDDETGGELFHRLCDAGGDLLVRTVGDLERGSCPLRLQDPAEATHFGPPQDRDARIDWNADSETIRNLVRGFHPRPGAWTMLEGERIGVHSATSVDLPASVPPGTILRTTHEGLLVGTGGGTVLIQATGPGGKRLDSDGGLGSGMAFKDDPHVSPSPRA